jgi:2-polyprenyl-6-methoxyphenol hydroxylase-like FAD-dependent oxidoreductase
MAPERHLWASSFRLGQGQTDAYAIGRWALAGDAAHAMGPSAGAGMQVGVLGAWRLSHQLMGSLREPATWSARSAGYESAQRRLSSSVQRSNARTFGAMTVTSPLAGAVRRVALGGVGRLPFVTRTMTAAAALSGLAPHQGRL